VGLFNPLPDPTILFQTHSKYQKKTGKLLGIDK